MVEVARRLDRVFGARMTGVGFGGCTINLVESKMGPEFQRNIAREYEKVTGLSPHVFVSCAAEGASQMAL